MSPTQSRVRVALSSSALDTGPGREFFQDRLGLFGLWNAVLAGGFLLLRIVAEGVIDARAGWGAAIQSPGIGLHALAVTAAAATWAAMRRTGPQPTRVLLAVDSVLVVLLGVLYAAMGGVLATNPTAIVNEPRAAMLTATLAIAFTLVWHSVAVPSTPQRCAALLAAAVAPLVYADFRVLGGPPYDLQHAVGPVFGTGWAVLTVATATVACDVVFGLRREVQRVERLGQYTLEEKIGEGAMGVVYRAHHAMLRRPTAIKLLPRERAGEASLRRFEREVQLTARLTHPNTVAIYDYGRTPEGVFYYAMELLDGVTLEDLVRDDGPQPDGRVIHVLRQVCRALSEAHALGLIHRDVKPANIMLTIRGGEPDVAKVVDFGLVKRLDPSDATVSQTQEATGVLAGTPLYFSPEAIASPDEVDGRSDLYALGAVGYVLLTGVPVFEGRTLFELCGHHLHTPPVPPSVRIGRALDPTLEALLLQCLAKTPSERPASAMALHDALGTSAAASDWTPEMARHWWSSQKPRTGLGLTPPVSDAMTMSVDLGAR